MAATSISSNRAPRYSTRLRATTSSPSIAAMVSARPYGSTKPTTTSRPSWRRRLASASIAYVLPTPGAAPRYTWNSARSEPPDSPTSAACLGSAGESPSAGSPAISSYRGFHMTTAPSRVVAHPSTAQRAPGSMPAMAVRPRNSSSSVPVSSASVASNATPRPTGRTRVARIVPRTVTRVDTATSPIPRATSLFITFRPSSHRREVLVEFEDVHIGLAKEPELGAVDVLRDQVVDLLLGQSACRRDDVNLGIRGRRRDVGIDPAARTRHQIGLRRDAELR